MTVKLYLFNQINAEYIAVAADIKKHGYCSILYYDSVFYFVWVENLVDYIKGRT
jgi:hypothetical protein